jgi:hypothetical protein
VPGIKREVLEMARERRETKAEPVGFPYEAQRGTPVWEVVDRAINNLVDNKDIVETTQRDYIVGYICKKLERLLPRTSD